MSALLFRHLLSLAQWFICKAGQGTDKRYEDSIHRSGGMVKYWRQPLDKDRIRVPHGIIHVIEERCKGCGFCVEFCPRGVFVMSKRTNLKGYHPPEVTAGSQCADCGLCALLCPDFAIYVESSERPPTNNGETQ